MKIQLIHIGGPLKGKIQEFQESEVKVKANPIYATKRFMTHNRKWIATALILPILGWAIKTMMK